MNLILIKCVPNTFFQVQKLTLYGSKNRSMVNYALYSTLLMVLRLWSKVQ